MIVRLRRRVGFLLGDEGGRPFSRRDGAGLSWRWRGAATTDGAFQAAANDLSRSLATLEADRTLIAVIEMGQSSWLVAGIVPGIERHPVKKFEPDAEALLRLLQRWQEEACQGRPHDHPYHRCLRGWPR